MEFVVFFQVSTGRWSVFFVLQNRGAQSGMAERDRFCTGLGRGVCVRSKFRQGPGVSLVLLSDGWGIDERQQIHVI